MSHEPAKPRVMVTARAVLLHRGRVLLLRAEEPGREYYFLPGGMVRHGERMEDACVREVAEETGIEVRVLRPLYFREFIAARHRRRARGMPEHHHVVALVFLCEVAGPQAQQDC
ncbi:MAG: NUDIX hydrolase, partial [Planctomycetes bacterium]|nr:NUDIX hydrolase [Planctomycetota bacterium]